MAKYYYLCKVSMEKALKELTRYKFNTISDVIFLYVVFMAMFLGIKSFGKSFGVSPIDMGDSLEGFIAGFFLWTIMMMTYSGVAYGLTNDANRGTLEQLNMSGIRLSTIVTARSLSDLFINIIVSVVLLFIIMATTGYKLEIRMLPILFPVIVGMFSILGIGLIFGGLALIFKKIQTLLNIVQYFFIALIMINPGNKIIYNLLPFKTASDMVISSMRYGYSLTDFSIYYYVIMAGNSALYFGIGLFIFNRCVKLAKMKGLLGQY